MGRVSHLPGSTQEMSSLRAEHGGVVGILLILYAIQIYMGPIETPESYTIKIWIDNTDVLDGGATKRCGKTLKERMVIDYDLWMVIQSLQNKVKFKLAWHKVDSHIETRTYKHGAKPQGDAYSIRLNQRVDVWAGETRDRSTVTSKGTSYHQ